MDSGSTKLNIFVANRHNFVGLLKVMNSKCRVLWCLCYARILLKWSIWGLPILAGDLKSFRTKMGSKVSGPLHTRDWEPVTNTLQALSLVEKVEPVQVRFTLCLRDQRSLWMQDGCNVHMDSYMASNGSRFMVTWIIFKKSPCGVGLTQNGETMALRMLTTVHSFYFYHAWGHAWIGIH